MRKLTKGPWKVYKRPEPIGYAAYEIHWSDDGECVAEVVHEEADAYAIAAVPEMVEALKTAVSWLTETLEGRSIPQVSGEPGTWLQKSLEALKKAGVE